MITIPDWAKRHHYWWHSNPKNKDRAKVFFDKCVVRPAIKKSWAVIKDDNSTPDDKEQAWDVIYKLDPGYNGSDNANMLGGRIVQSACDAILIERKDPVLVYENALKEFIAYNPRTWDNGIDAAKWTQYQEELISVIENSVAGLREAMASLPTITGESEIYGALPGNELGHKNLPDYVGVGDLKTKWSSRSSRSKTGFQTNSLPKDLSGRFDIQNVFQVAGGWALNGRKPVWLLYANKSDFRIFNQANCDQLHPEYLEQVVNEIRLSHRTTENLLKTAEDTDQLLSLVYPDWDNIGWDAPEGYKQEANKIWGMN